MINLVPDFGGGGWYDVFSFGGHGQYGYGGGGFVPGPPIYDAQDVYDQNRRDVQYYSGGWRYGPNPPDDAPLVQQVMQQITQAATPTAQPDTQVMATTQATTTQTPAPAPTVTGFRDWQAEETEARSAITNFYQTFLGREPDAGGLAFWIDNWLHQGGTYESIRQAFRDSAEFDEIYAITNPIPPNSNDSSVVPTDPTVNANQTLAQLFSGVPNFGGLLSSLTNQSSGGKSASPAIVIPGSAPAESPSSIKYILLLVVAGLVVAFAVHHFKKHIG